MAAWAPSRLTPEQLEERRMEAARLLRRGWLSQSEIARRLGVSRQSVSQWKKHLDRERISGLRRRPHTGRHPGIGSSQWEELTQILEQGAQAAGFESERRTLRRIGHVLRSRLGIWIRLEWLPGYAPEANPEELCNGWVKNETPNALPKTNTELRESPRRAFRSLGQKPEVLRGFFAHAGLSVN